MKTIPVNLKAHYQGGATTFATGMRITRTDAEVFGLSSHDVDAEIDGVTYVAGGIASSSVTSSAGLDVDTLSMTTLDNGALFDRADVLGGLWQNAAFLIFRYNWANLADGVEPLIAGTFGNVQLLDGSVVVELRGLQQYLQQPVGAVSTKTCRARLGDALCTVDLGLFTHAGTVSAFTSAQAFTASNLSTEVDDYFGEGLLTWLTGANAGLRQKIKTHATGGVFGLMLPMPSAIANGDTFSVIAGCRKRLEDCRDKFDNVLNFQAEPHMPGVDEMTGPPEVNV